MLQFINRAASSGVAALTSVCSRADKRASRTQLMGITLVVFFIEDKEHNIVSTVIVYVLRHHLCLNMSC